MATKVQLVELAQDKLKEVIEILEVACKNDDNAQAYIIDHLKILCSDNHGFCDSSLNIDNLIERYEGDREDVGGDDFFEDD
jgi:hypothetical protein